METKVENESTIVAAKTYISESGAPRFACIKKDPSVSGYEVRIVDENAQPLYTKTVTLPDDSDLGLASFCHVPKFSKLLIRLDYGDVTELVTLDKESSFSFETVVLLPKGGIKQMRSNEWWIAFLATEQHNLSLFWMDLGSKGEIFRATLATNNKAPHLAVFGRTKNTTCFYLVERHGKMFHLTWVTPLGETNTSFALPFFSCLEEQILFMDTHDQRIVIVSQDKKMRHEMATLKVLILEHKDMQKKPEVVRTILLEDYHAPLGVSLADDGYLLFACKSTLAWVDIGKLEKSTAPDGYIDTKEKEAAKFAIVKEKQGALLILVWVPNVRDGCMSAVLFDEEGVQVKRCSTEFDITLNRDNQLETPKIFPSGKCFFGTLNGEANTYVRCFKLQI